MPRSCLTAPEQGAAQLLARYHALWTELGFRLEGREQPIPYNLLATREWMWLVPRCRETWEGLGANGLAFAGALMVRDEAEFSKLESIGPMELLTRVTSR
jgi:ATP adenylyltransferase